MKDLEKIKSEDLAVQVQDANPGNFAIEQEVAQLVGATVPQPTEPSADDARELGAQLLVFLRRALLPIQTALRTALAAIYAHLDSRCTDYTPAAYAPFRILPYDPMTTPRVPRTLPNLLTALTAFSARKISNGSATADGIPDGISLAHILGKGDDVLKIGDDNTPWGAMNRNIIFSTCPNVQELTLNCESLSVSLINGQSVKVLSMPYLQLFGSGNGLTLVWGDSEIEELYFPELTNIRTGQASVVGNLAKCTKARFPKLKAFDAYAGFYSASFLVQCPLLTEIDMSSFESITNFQGDQFIVNLPELTTCKIGKPNLNYRNFNGGIFQGCPKLIDLEFADGMSYSINLSGWNPTDKGTTFLQNFKEHIALRLTANGSGLTLTLSQAVFSAVIEGSSPICDDIKGIIEDKGWKVQDTNNNIFPTT